MIRPPEVIVTVLGFEIWDFQLVTSCYTDYSILDILCDDN